MKFHLEIDCDNSDFMPDNGDDDPEVIGQCQAAAVARIIRDAAKYGIGDPDQPERKLRDSNGNTVGRYWWTDD